MIKLKPHEYAPVQWIELASLTKLGVDLTKLKGRDLIGNEIELVNVYDEELKVLILSFYAEWCTNCHYEATPLKKLYSSHKSNGLNMVMVMNYSTKEKSLSFVNKYGLDMPLALGELDEKNERKRNNTQFHQFRKKLGDERAWGTPFHIIIEKDKPEKVGIVMGELIGKEIKNYLANTILKK